MTAYDVYGYAIVFYVLFRIAPDVAFLPFVDRLATTPIPRTGTYQRVRTGASYACGERDFRKRVKRSFSRDGELAEYPHVDAEHALAIDSMVHDPSRQGQHSVSFNSLNNAGLPGVALIDVLLGRADLEDSEIRPLADCRLPWLTLNVGAWDIEKLLDSADIIRLPVRTYEGDTLPKWALAHTAAWTIVNHLWRFRCLGLDTENINEPEGFLHAFDTLRKIRIFGLLDLDSPDDADTRAFMIHYEVL
ncbi:hypothetical protein AB1N83_001558 [Pleurotus pulmonarius]